MKAINKDQLIELITSGELTLRQIVTITTTPKEYVYIIGDSIHAVNDLPVLFRRILKEYPTAKANDGILINAKEYQEYLITI